MKNTYKPITILFALLIVLSGCVGAALRGGMTEKTTYRELLATIPIIESGKGRVFIYAPKGGPDIMSTLGVIDFISIDRDIFRFGGESYFYLDIETGSHKVTTTSVVKAGFKNKKRYGENTKSINVREREAIYLRIVAQKARVYELELASKSKAEEEMSTLPLWKNSMTSMRIE